MADVRDPEGQATGARGPRPPGVPPATADPSPPSGLAAQAEIRRLRHGLLGGRGPGASEREIARHTRDRPVTGAVPTVIERELVQVSTGLARGDLYAIERDLQPVRARLAVTLDALGERLAPHQLGTQLIRAARARIRALLGGHPEPAAPPAGPAADAGPPGAAPARDHPWGRWRVAAAGAAFGVLVTLATGRLTRTVRPRLARHPGGGPGGTGRARPGRPHRSSSRPHPSGR